MTTKLARWRTLVAEQAPGAVNHLELVRAYARGDMTTGELWRELRHGR